MSKIDEKTLDAIFMDKLDVLGVILDRPTAEKFREMCKPNTAEDVIETFVRNAVKSGVKYDDYIKGDE